MNNFMTYICANYEIIPDEKNQFSFNKAAKTLALSTTTFNKYMATFNYMSRKPRFILPKIQMLPDNLYDPVHSLPSEKVFFHYRLNKRNTHTKQGKEDLLDSLTSASKTTTEYSSLRIFHQNKDPLMNNILSFLTSKLALQDNSTFTKEKSIKTKRSQIDLSIESISIVFKKKGMVGMQKVIFPFDLMPFFYAVNHEHFLFFLSKVINISQDIATISINFNVLKDIVSKFIKFAPLLKGDSHFYKNIISKVANWKYDWIYNDQIFQLTIELPVVQCVLYGNNSKPKIKFVKVIEQSKVVELLKSNFVQWDNSMLLYLSQYKDFRGYAKELNRPQIKTISNKLMIVNLDNIVPSIDLDRQYYDFFITSKDESFYIKLFSYQFEVSIVFNVNESFTEFIIPTQLQDIYRLEALKAYFDLNELIKKCLIINKNDKTATLNSEIYKTIDESVLIKRDLQDNSVFKQDKMINVNGPRIDWKIFGRNIGNESTEGIKIIENSTELSPELISDLLSKPIHEWSSAIQANHKSFEADLSLFCSRRRSSLSKARSINKRKTFNKSPTIVMRNKKKTKNNGLINLLVI